MRFTIIKHLFFIKSQVNYKKKKKKKKKKKIKNYKITTKLTK